MGDEGTKLNDTSDINQLSNIFAYLMLLFSLFIIGFVFLVINVPLLMKVLIPYGVISSGILQGVNFGATFSVQYLFSTLILGFILNPFSQINSQISSLIERKIGILEFIFKKLGRQNDFDFFNPMRFLDKKYPELSVWLLKNKPEKLSWEWELFNHNLYWGLSTNAFIFFMLNVFILKSFILWLFLLLSMWLILTCISLFRSATMGALHTHLTSIIK